MPTLPSETVWLVVLLKTIPPDVAVGQILRKAAHFLGDKPPRVAIGHHPKSRDAIIITLERVGEPVDAAPSPAVH